MTGISVRDQLCVGACVWSRYVKRLYIKIDNNNWFVYN